MVLIQSKCSAIWLMLNISVSKNSLSKHKSVNLVNSDQWKTFWALCAKILKGMSKQRQGFGWQCDCNDSS